MPLKTKRFVILAATVLVVSVMAPAAQAALTAISPAPSGELSLLGSGGILDTLYGLSNLQRISDAFTGDQLWELTSSGATVTGVAKYSGFSQEFGVIPGSSGGTFIPLFTDTGSVALPALAGEFRFGIDPSGAPLWSSLQSDNSDGGLDHMVAWLITTTGNYVLAWEDLPGLGDRDYNDLVVEVHGAVPGTPEPGTLLLLGSGVVGMGAMTRRRSRRK